MQYKTVAVRLLVFLLLAGMVTNVASAQYRDTWLGRWEKCLDEAYLELNACLSKGGYWNDFQCDRAFELNEAACDIAAMGDFVWPW